MLPRALRWDHRSFWGREWELREGDVHLATLRQVGWWGLDADIATPDGQALRIRHEGWARPTMRVERGPGDPILRLRVGWRGQGDVLLADGRKLPWGPLNWWGTRWSLRTEGGRPVAEVDVGSSWGFTGKVRIGDEDGLTDEQRLAALGLTWLVLVYTLQAGSSATIIG